LAVQPVTFIDSETSTEIQQALEGGSPARRLAALWYTTDALLTGQYSEDQIWTFGEIINQLAADIERRARATLAERLCRSPNSPRHTIRELAFDDAIEVSGPVLAYSERLDDAALTAVARTKGQQHLRAIAGRTSLSETVTDILVERGDRDVVRRVVDNEGARFSTSGFFNLVKRCDNDAILVESLGNRKDIPRHLFLQLIARASEEVKARLCALLPNSRREVAHVVADVTGAVQATVGPASREFYEARRALTGLHRVGRLGERELIGFIRARQHLETILALSLLTGLSVDAVERVFVGQDTQMVLLIAKAADLSWSTVKALLLSFPNSANLSENELSEVLRRFTRLSAQAAREVIDFFETRRRKASSPVAYRGIAS
jgi:uncharacterized protein (DUF2336 family)